MAQGHIDPARRRSGRRNNVDESVDFTIDNNRYQMDLNENNAARLRQRPRALHLRPHAASAGLHQTTRTRRSTIRCPPGWSRSGNSAAIREWAGANGFSVSTRGRIAASLREAYENWAVPTATMVIENTNSRGRGQAEAPVTQEVSLTDFTAE